jgi:predicted negative regulator of RcsB-dependent stress response
MASSLDHEEQDQLEEIKHFWSKHGSLLTWILIVMLAAYSAWNGWQYWQNRQALQASVLFQSVDQALSTSDETLVERSLADMQEKFSSATYASHASLLAAKFWSDHAKPELSKKALVWVVDHASDQGLVSIARLRLASLALDAKKTQEAKDWLEKEFPKAYEALANDRMGDALMAEHNAQEAKTKYLAAWRAMSERTQYRQIVEVKLAALGVDVHAQESQP